ncbi:MAG: WYL domain-containing protein, partial [Lachnospiraceae bacterium]|nr:WYL domain-containing protein [Lachnospiraceae bacterium]
MARSSNQKLKLLYLVRIFREETDEDHGLSTEEIIGRLNAYGVNADRKTLYSDFEELRTFG